MSFAIHTADISAETQYTWTLSVCICHLPAT